MEKWSRMIRVPDWITVHHQKLITSTGSPLADADHVWLMSATAIYAAQKTTERMNDHTTPPASVEQHHQQS